MNRYLLPALLLASPVIAAEPYCLVQESCIETSDNCQPAEGRLEMRVQDSGKALVYLNDAEPLEATPLMMGQMVQMIFAGPDRSQHQLRIAPDGKFNYLIDTPNPEAHKGKDQILYRGQCQEG